MSWVECEECDGYGKLIIDVHFDVEEDNVKCVDCGCQTFAQTKTVRCKNCYGEGGWDEEEPVICEEPEPEDKMFTEFGFQEEYPEPQFKYYAVKIGRKTRIFPWKEWKELKNSIIGYPNPEWAGFDDYDSAKQFLDPFCVKERGQKTLHEVWKC